MEGISWNLLLQIPLAGVVVLVVVLFLRHLKEVTSTFMAAQVKQVEITALAQKEQMTMFMDAIKNQREENIKAIINLTSKIDGLGTLIATSLTEMRSARSDKKPITKN